MVRTGIKPLRSSRTVTAASCTSRMLKRCWDMISLCASRTVSGMQARGIIPGSISDMEEANVQNSRLTALHGIKYKKARGKK